MTATTASALPGDVPATPATPVRPGPLRIALIAHDGKKDEMVVLANEFARFLSGCELVATGTTGTRLNAEVGLTVERMLSGPHGGDLQIGARLAVGGVDAVVFLRDPMTPQPHEPDINALVRACDVHNVACATNVASARLMLGALQDLHG
jgi:methylglyoxal synthase